MTLGKDAKNKKNINDGFMYVCVAKKCEMMVFHFVFVSTVVFIDKFPPSLGKKRKMMVFYVCMYV